MSKVPAGVSIAAKLANLLPSTNAELAPVPEGVYVDDSLPPATHKTCSKNPKRGVCRNGGAPPIVLVIPQGGGYRGQA